MHKLMEGIDFERAKKRLPRKLFLAMQSVPEEEAAHIANTPVQWRFTTADARIKLYHLYPRVRD